MRRRGARDGVDRIEARLERRAARARRRSHRRRARERARAAAAAGDGCGGRRESRRGAGKRDGLYWPVKAGEAQSPLGPELGRATYEGYRFSGDSRPTSYHGHLFRILTAQGPNAPGGAYEYRVNGRLVGGFALVAWPARYGSSGVKTFLVNHDGTAWEKDLGPATAKVAGTMTRFDPDSSWSKP